MTRTSTHPIATILIVEDDPGFLKLVATELSEQGYTTIPADSLQAARQHLSAEKIPIDLVLSDLRLPDGAGSEILEEIKLLRLRPAFILLTAFGTISQAVELLKAGADNFLTKPLDFEQLHIAVARALEYRRMKFELDRLKAVPDARGFHGMIGDSPKMRNLAYEIRQVALTQEPVLLIGESGTGKELVASAIHRESPRADKPFVPVNCAAIPAELIESELFGHERGAFTGADRKKTGLFMAAEGGTLFLDEIGDLPIGLQAKLLRVLQEQTIRPVGATAEIPIDVRIVAATHRNLENEVQSRTFREDLYYRLEALTLRIPPLRERGADIEVLALHLLKQIGDSMGKPAASFAPEVLEAFHHYPFPGNIRELENVVKKMLVFATGERALGPELLPVQIRGGRGLEKSAGNGMDPRQAPFQIDPPFPPLEHVKQLYLQHVLDAFEGNKRQTAQQLGIGRRTLYSMLDRGNEKTL